MEPRTVFKTWTQAALLPDTPPDHPPYLLLLPVIFQLLPVSHTPFLIDYFFCSLFGDQFKRPVNMIWFRVLVPDVGFRCCSSAAAALRPLFIYSLWLKRSSSANLKGFEKKLNGGMETL